MASSPITNRCSAHDSSERRVVRIEDAVNRISSDVAVVAAFVRQQEKQDLPAVVANIACRVSAIEGGRKTLIVVATIMPAIVCAIAAILALVSKAIS